MKGSPSLLSDWLGVYVITKVYLGTITRDLCYQYCFCHPTTPPQLKETVDPPSLSLHLVAEVTDLGYQLGPVIQPGLKTEIKDTGANWQIRHFKLWEFTMSSNRKFSGAWFLKSRLTQPDPPDYSPLAPFAYSLSLLSKPAPRLLIPLPQPAPSLFTVLTD